MGFLDSGFGLSSIISSVGKSIIGNFATKVIDEVSDLGREASNKIGTLARILGELTGDSFDSSSSSSSSSYPRYDSSSRCSGSSRGLSGVDRYESFLKEKIADALVEEFVKGGNSTTTSSRDERRAEREKRREERREDFFKDIIVSSITKLASLFV